MDPGVVKGLGAVALAVALAVIAIGPRVAAAEAPCDRITAVIDADVRRARAWNLGWAVAFGVAAAGQAVAAAGIPDGSISEANRAGLWVGAAKAAIGTLGRIAVPLRLAPARDCADAPRALAAAARRERLGFWLNTAGGFLVNASGALYLGLGREAWGTAAVSFAVGTAVSVLSAYSAPRGAWRGGAVVVTPTVGGLALSATW